MRDINYVRRRANPFGANFFSLVAGEFCVRHLQAQPCETGAELRRPTGASFSPDDPSFGRLGARCGRRRCRHGDDGRARARTRLQMMMDSGASLRTRPRNSQRGYRLAALSQLFARFRAGRERRGNLTRHLL